MSLLVPPRRFDPAVREIMDRPGNEEKLLRADLRVLEDVNRFLGGYRIPLLYLRKLSSSFRSTKPLTILDLATGAADVPRAIATWARSKRIDVAITAVDGNPEILRIARENTTDWPEICIEQQNLLSLPYSAASFDIVLCSLALHHFSEVDAVAILRSINHIARGSWIINDLRRNRFAIGLSKLMAHTIITNPIARFDAPASCERAFTVPEWHLMATRAGMNHFMIRRHRFFRMALSGHK
jgi:2-polyprenyl-3-methyl-5-hydroxy-6-metoxy-1,4-benzoquinol methylase